MNCLNRIQEPRSESRILPLAGAEHQGNGTLDGAPHAHMLPMGPKQSLLIPEDRARARK